MSEQILESRTCNDHDISTTSFSFAVNSSLFLKMEVRASD